MSIDPFDTLPLPGPLIAELRSDHAGEAGAVAMYRGILALSRQAEVRRFALRHLRAELRHLRFFDRWLPECRRSRLLPLWRAAGWILGALSAGLGSRAVYSTVAAVETFVERHYLAQIAAIPADSELAPLAARLRVFCDEEIRHRDDAAARLAGPAGTPGRAWSWIIDAGSSIGVRIARRI